MYIEMVRRIVEDAAASFAVQTQKTVPDVLEEIREHIDRTAREHRTSEPDIDYKDPLCRLGYLYRHATANATLFERVLRDCGELQQKVRQSDGGKLHIASIGGGPGTELLGLAKYLLRAATSTPRKITFTVLDAVPQWAETWQQLADEVEKEFGSALPSRGRPAPSIAPVFLPMNVVDPTSYQSYAYQFRSVDIVVFNYLFSENKTALAEATGVVKHLRGAVPPGCVFIVIDRHEADGKFTEAVVKMFVDAGASTPPTVHKISGTLDSDERTSEMGEMLKAVLGVPRVKFFTDTYRDPTVFWFGAIRSPT